MGNVHRGLVSGLWPSDCFQTVVVHRVTAFRSTVSGRLYVAPWSREITMELSGRNERICGSGGMSFLSDTGSVCGAWQRVPCHAQHLPLSAQVVSQWSATDPFSAPRSSPRRAA